VPGSARELTGGREVADADHADLRRAETGLPELGMNLLRLKGGE
jgi:hypothetical protein